MALVLMAVSNIVFASRLLMHPWVILDEYRPVANRSRKCLNEVRQSTRSHRHFDLEARTGVGAIGDKNAPACRFDHRAGDRQTQATVGGGPSCTFSPGRIAGHEDLFQGLFRYAGPAVLDRQCQSFGSSRGGGPFVEYDLDAPALRHGLG